MQPVIRCTFVQPGAFARQIYRCYSSTMIIRPRPSLLQLFFILRGSVITRIFPQVLVVFALSALIVELHRISPGLISGGSGAPFTLLGIALSIFLGFRNNACYDRWWEARKDWGQLVFAARGFARQTLLLDAAGEAGIRSRRDLLQLTMAFSHALVRHLRLGGRDDKV